MVPCAEPNRTEPNRIEPNRPIDRPTEPTDPTTEEVRHFLTFVFDNQCRGQARNRRAPTGQLFARSSADSPPEGFTASEGEEKHPHRCRSRRHSHGPVARKQRIIPRGGGGLRGIGREAGGRSRWWGRREY